jgi:hypothetical protein
VSNALLNAVWPLEMPMARKFVLVALADYANDSGLCFPSVQAIAIRCSAGERTVQENLKALEADGYVERQFAKGRATVYRITDPRNWRTPAAAAPPHEAHPRGADDDNGPPQQPHPTPAAAAPLTIKSKSLKKEQELKPQHDSRRGTRLPDDWRPSTEVVEWAKQHFPGIGLRAIYDEFMDHWRSVPGAKGRHLDWNATFRNRVRAVAGRNPRGNQNGTYRPSAVENVKHANHAAKEREHYDIIGEFRLTSP